MANGDSTNILHEQVGASTGEYEYDYGSYADLLEKQLAAIKNRAQLEEEERKETGLLGTRNMAVLNLALTGRGVIESVREKYIMNQMQDMGDEAKFITNEKYESLDDVDKAIYKKSADGRWFTGDWQYSEGPDEKWKQIGNALIGWQQGIEKVIEGGEKPVAPSGPSIDATGYNPNNPFGEQTVGENVSPVATDNITIPGGKPPNKGMLDTTYRPPPSTVMDNYNALGPLGKRLHGGIGTTDEPPVKPDVDLEVEDAADEEVKPRLRKMTKDEISKSDLSNKELMDSGFMTSDPITYDDDLQVPVDDSNIPFVDQEPIENYSDAMVDLDNETLADLPASNVWEGVGKKKTSKSSVAGAGIVVPNRVKSAKTKQREEYLDFDSTIYTQDIVDDHLRSSKGVRPKTGNWVGLKGGAVRPEDWDALNAKPVKPKMTSKQWENMNKKEQASWRKQMKSEMNVLESSNKMEKRSSVLEGLDSLKKLKASIVNKIMPPKGYSPSAAFKVDNKSLYKQMRASGIKKTW
jgi:hypothetical protein